MVYFVGLRYFQSLSTPSWECFLNFFTPRTPRAPPWHYTGPTMRCVQGSDLKQLASPSPRRKFPRKVNGHVDHRRAGEEERGRMCVVNDERSIFWSTTSDERKNGCWCVAGKCKWGVPSIQNTMLSIWHDIGYPILGENFRGR